MPWAPRDELAGMPLPRTEESTWNGTGSMWWPPLGDEALSLAPRKAGLCPRTKQNAKCMLEQRAVRLGYCPLGAAFLPG